jgi:hypothetical protein
MSAAAEKLPAEHATASGRAMRSVRITALVGLLAGSALIELYTRSSLRSPASSDFWWHLRTGLWILENHAIPHVGIYSQSAETPWIATSWLFDTVSALGYKLVDLRIAPVVLAAGKVVLGVVGFVLAGGLRGRFWAAIGLAAMVEYILFGVPLGPVYASILGFGITLWVLMEARRAREPQRIIWLAPVLLLWANFDNDFVYGVAVLGLFLASTVIDEIAGRNEAGWAKPGSTKEHVVRHAAIAVAVCMLATLCTPYFYRGYGVFFASASSAANRFLPVYHAISFRDPRDYLLLLLTMSAFLALGMRRSRDPFQISLMVLSAAWSFHLHSYAWMVVLASVAVIGDAIGGSGLALFDETQRMSLRDFQVAAVFAVVVVLAGVAFLPRNHEALVAEMRPAYPVTAAEFIRANRLPQPLFNSCAWGGFLMWYLPEYPVAIDGRTPLYNDEANIRYARFMRSDFSYREYAPVMRAHTILLERASPMAQVLSGVPGFQVAYSDNVAMVLLHEGTQP